MKLTMRLKSQIPYMPSFSMNRAEQQRVGNAAIKAMNSRLDKGLDVEDRNMSSYAERPIYVSLVPYKGAKANTSLKMTPEKLRLLRRQGIPVVDARKIKGHKLGQAGKAKKMVIRNKRTIKFPSYQAYKQALGHPGFRDIELTGATRRGIVIIENLTGPRSVGIGIVSNRLSAIARGNMREADWFGLSPTDAVKVTRVVDDINAEHLRKLR